MLEEDFKKINELLANTSGQDGGPPNTTNMDPKTSSNQVVDTTPSRVDENMPVRQLEAQEEAKRFSENEQVSRVQNTSVNYVDENMETSNHNEEDSYHNARHDDATSQSRLKTKMDTTKKSKRGRKKKNRDGNDGSTESDSDLFNYDKFLKKVSKKGTRVHMNVRMLAIRTIVPGSKVVLQANSKMSMGNKGEEKAVVANTQNQQNQRVKMARAQEQEKHLPMEDEVEDNERIDANSSNKGKSDYLHAGEDFYNVDGYDVGRYNLRRRGAQKKYYDDDPELEDDDEPNYGGKKKEDYGYMEDDYKQTSRKPNAGAAYGRRVPDPESSYQSKTKRKKRDDDEDYVAEEDEEVDDQEDFSANKKANELPRGNEISNNFGATNVPPFGYMQQGSMPNQFSMYGQFPGQNPMSKFKNLNLSHTVNFS